MVAAARMVAFGEYVDDGTASAMKARDYKDATDLVVQPIAAYAIQGSMIGRNDKSGPQGDGINVEVCFTQNTIDRHGVAYGIRTANTSSNGWGIQEEVTHTLDCAQGVAVAQPIGLDEEQNAMIDAFGTLKARTAGGGFEGTVMQTNMAVRRLTPVECERLQGFPDEYTNIKDKCPDSPRYKALGNSWAVPVVRWIGERIDALA
jgi:DNA (cytosine-5)-methyltransferase 1